MELNLTGLAIFFILLLASIGFISNISPASQKNIQDQMYMQNCPMPIFQGVAGNVTFTSYFAFNYTQTYPTGSNNQTGTYFKCRLDFLSSNHPSLSIIPKEYGHTSFGFIPDGWLSFAGDSLSVLFLRLQAFFTLIAYYITPINFSILGYTISDLSTLAITFVISIYALSYITIGAWLYKILSPFSGVS